MTETISELDFILSLSQALDLVSTAVAGHHRRVAFITAEIAAAAGFSPGDTRDAVLAAAVHDAGALSLQDRIDSLLFDVRDPWLHPERGYLLLKECPTFAAAAELVRYHHLPWQDGAGAERFGQPVPRGAHLLQLADRIDILLDRDIPPLAQAERVRELIRSQAGAKFDPALVEAFCATAQRECFWLQIGAVSNGDPPPIRSAVGRHLGLAELEELAELFTKIIDFRSRFTVRHSAGVAAISEQLASLAGMTGDDLTRMRIAGRLHDLGKLAVPAEVLDRPTRLEPAHRHLIKSHTFHTFRILRRFGPLQTVAKWAAYHHERMDGTGYPFHLPAEKLCTGSRIMMVADVLTALTEDRPYREAMPAREVKNHMRKKKGRSLDYDLTSLALREFDQLTEVRQRAQERVFAELVFDPEGPSLPA